MHPTMLSSKLMSSFWLKSRSLEACSARVAIQTEKLMEKMHIITNHNKQRYTIHEIILGILIAHSFWRHSDQHCEIMNPYKNTASIQAFITHFQFFRSEAAWTLPFGWAANNHSSPTHFFSFITEKTISKYRHNLAHTVRLRYNIYFNTRCAMHRVKYSSLNSSKSDY
jgi:hypothetical protein